MSTSLLATKLYFPPVRPNLVSRPHLLERLEAGLRGPLTLVAAPAGYGKTTLLGEWRAGPGAKAAIAWFSLDAGDNEPTRFFHYTTAAFDTIRPGLTQNTSRLLQSPQPPPLENLGTALLNDLRNFEGDLLLVLDDYHIITNSEVHTALTFLLDHLPPHLHLVILTRADPPLPLARLRARGHLIEIRAADLRFTTLEATAFLNEIMCLNLEESEVAALEARTEGWIAGLQLVALSMQGREDIPGFIATFTGSHHYIVDYLIEEVLKSQPEKVRGFLLKTSILERLNGPLCDALTGENNGQATLEMLAHANLFLIPLDDERRWFRYHHLFADLLRHRLNLTQPNLVQELHRKAAIWLEQVDSINEAVVHALHGQDFEFVVRIIAQQGIRLARETNLNILLQWMDTLPASYWNSNAELNMIRIYLLWSMRRVDEVEVCLQQVEGILETQRQIDPDVIYSQNYQLTTANILSIRSRVLYIHGNLKASIEMANQALEIAPEGSDLLRGITYSGLLAMHRVIGQFDKAIHYGKKAVQHCSQAGHHVLAVDSLANLAAMQIVLGQLHQAHETLQNGFAYIESQAHNILPSFSIISVVKAEVLLKQNRLNEASSAIRDALQLAELSGRTYSLLQALLVNAEIQSAMGQKLEALDSLGKIIHKLAIDKSEQDLETIFCSEWLRAKIQSEMGNHFFAQELVEKFSNRQPALGFVTECKVEIYMASLLVVLGQLDEAQESLIKLAAKFEQAGLFGWLIEVLVLQSLVGYKKKQIELAFIPLEKALKLAAPENYCSIFVDCGQPMQELLQAASKKLHDKTLARFTQRLLSAFGSDSSVSSLARQALLSERELEVLRLIAAGCSNKEIAGKLVIAIGTVKRHTVNIFTKLDVKNRTEAAAKARELGLL